MAASKTDGSLTIRGPRNTADTGSRASAKHLDLLGESIKERAIVGPQSIGSRKGGMVAPKIDQEI